MRRFVVIVIALLALAVAAPTAGAVTFPVTNGRDTAAWVQGQTLHVSYDDGTSRTFPAPAPDCGLGGVNSTAAGFLCGTPDVISTLDLVDLQSGQRSHPANEAEIEASTGPTADRAAYTLDALGDHVARIYIGSLHDDGPEWLSLDAGAALPDLSHPPVGSVVDLDAPTGLTRVCDPAPTRTLKPLLFRAPWILTQNGPRVQLRRCGSTVTRLIGRSSWRRPLLTSRFAAWRSDSTHITIRVLASGRTYRVPAPHLQRMVATDHRLWTDAYPGRPRVFEVR